MKILCVLILFLFPCTAFAQTAAAPPAESAAPAEAPPPQAVAVKIPDGTLIELEAAYDVSSKDVKVGEEISFRVATPVLVGGRVVIEAGATATGRIVKASRGGHFGRAGRLAWKMEEVIAADGTRIPLKLDGRVVGDSKGAKVATKAVVTGVLLWPIAPVALLHGFKRGDNAYLPAGKRFEAFVNGDAAVSVNSPR
jgi:hypothetical protein